MTPAAVIFDFDGVIADSEVRSNRSLAAFLTANDMPITYEECLEAFYGHNWLVIESLIAKRFGRPLPPGFRQSLQEHHRTYFRDDYAAVPGAGEFIDRLDDMPRAIASSSSAEYIRWSLERFGFDRHFGDHVYSADGWERGKPHPDIYLAAAGGLGLPPEQCLAIEDSPTGARAAVAAGMTVVGFCGAGHVLDQAAHGKQLLEVGVHHLAFSFEDIPLALAPA